TLYRLLRGGAARAATRLAPPLVGARPPLAPVPQAGPALGPMAASSRDPAPALPSAATAPASPSGATAPSYGPPGGSRSSLAAAASPRQPELTETSELAEPPPAEGKVVRLRLPPRQDRLRWLAVAAPRILAAAVAAGLLAMPWIAPRRLLLPFPWQESSRVAFERNQSAARFLQLDRAARTFFLLEGHYPDALEELVPALLPADALRDSAGNPLAYSTNDRSYQVLPVLDGRPAAELGAREAITGDFLLDPEFLHLPERPDVAPLVLLD
ncbi:MAG TPA: hypothetical protein VFE44_05735, partial [Thermoanaerobaculia bacterium]|nr:hypothetical protein [Thermoanaerobaculia bacterium]